MVTAFARASGLGSLSCLATIRTICAKAMSHPSTTTPRSICLCNALLAEPAEIWSSSTVNSTGLRASFLSVTGCRTFSFLPMSYSSQKALLMSRAMPAWRITMTGLMSLVAAFSTDL